jgi:hypothetical protein
MRLPEKTIELNFCSQLAAFYGGPCFWFGLTQKQEARAGLDAAVRFNARIYIFQFKASCHGVGGARRFHAPHTQLVNLRSRASVSRSVFYVLPEVGTTSELGGSSDLLGRSWLLDAADLRDVQPPVTPWQTLRRNQRHYFDLRPPVVHIHAPMYEKKVFTADRFSPERARDEKPSGLGFEARFEDFWSQPSRFTGVAAAFAVLPGGYGE